MDKDKIKPYGYEFHGWKLGEKVRYKDTERTIIAFDEDDSNTPIMLSNGWSPITYVYATAILEGENPIDGKFVKEEWLTKIKNGDDIIC